MAVFSVSKPLNRVKKIPTCVAVNSADPRVSLFTCLVVCFLCCWVIQNELLDLLISPCELILVLLIVN